MRRATTTLPRLECSHRAEKPNASPNRTLTNMAEGRRIERPGITPPPVSNRVANHLAVPSIAERTGVEPAKLSLVRFPGGCRRQLSASLSMGEIETPGGENGIRTHDGNAVLA